MMFCPNCKAEYREGFTSCSDCHVTLVKELPEELEERKQEIDNQEFIDYKPVLSTHNTGDIMVIKSILDKEYINYYFKGENFNSLRPAAQPAILMVQDKQIKEVQGLLKDFKIQFIMVGTFK